MGKDQSSPRSPTPIDKGYSVAYGQDPEYHGKYVSPQQLAGVYYQPLFNDEPVTGPVPKAPIQATPQNSRVIGASPEYQTGSLPNSFRPPIKDPGPGYESEQGPVTIFLSSKASSIKPIPEVQKVAKAIESLQRKMGNKKVLEEDQSWQGLDDAEKYAQASGELGEDRAKLDQLGVRYPVPELPPPRPPPVPADPVKGFEPAPVEPWTPPPEAPRRASYGSSRENTYRKR